MFFIFFIKNIKHVFIIYAKNVTAQPIFGVLDFPEQRNCLSVSAMQIKLVSYLFN